MWKNRTVKRELGRIHFRTLGTWEGHNVDGRIMKVCIFCGKTEGRAEMKICEDCIDDIDCCGLEKFEE